jgi:hypothetical protein
MFDKPTVVDDDGTGTSGTVLDAAFLDDFGDRIDDAIGLEQTTSSTGNLDDFNLNGEFTILRCTGAAPVFRGFTVKSAAPTPGCKVLIQCLGSTSAKVAHQDTNSTAANRIITPSTSGQIVGVDGWILLVYDGTTDRWRLAGFDPGGWLSYGATSTVVGWAATPTKNIFYRQRGKSVDVFFHITGTSNADGTTFTLPFTSYNSSAAFTQNNALGMTLDNGAQVAAGYSSLADNSATVTLFRSAATAWTASGTKTISGQFRAEIT